MDPNLQTQLFAETDCNTEINTVVFLQVFVDIMQGRGIFVTEHMQSQSRSTGPYFTFFQLLCAKNKTKQNNTVCSWSIEYLCFTYLYFFG